MNTDNFLRIGWPYRVVKEYVHSNELSSAHLKVGQILRFQGTNSNPHDGDFTYRFEDLKTEVGFIVTFAIEESSPDWASYLVQEDYR